MNSKPRIELAGITPTIVWSIISLIFFESAMRIDGKFVKIAGPTDHFAYFSQTLLLLVLLIIVACSVIVTAYYTQSVLFADISNAGEQYFAGEELERQGLVIEVTKRIYKYMQNAAALSGFVGVILAMAVKIFIVGTLYAGLLSLMVLIVAVVFTVLNLFFLMDKVKSLTPLIIINIVLELIVAISAYNSPLLSNFSQ